MEQININDENELTSTFKLSHSGSKVLLSDLLEDYDETKSFFEKHDKMNFFPSNVKLDLQEGTYDIFITEKKYDKWGKRVKEVTIFNELYDYEVNNLGLDNWFDIYTLGIDGGSFMFVSDDVLSNKVEFDVFLEKWMSGETKGNILKYNNNDKVIAFGTSSGFGDGTYDVSIYKDNDNIVGIYISFINEEGEDTGLDKKEFVGGYTNDNYLSSCSDDNDSDEDESDESDESDDNNDDEEYEGSSDNDQNDDKVDENISEETQ